MNYKKGFVTPLIIAIVAVLAVGGGLYYKKITTPIGYEWPAEFYEKSTTTNPIIGGDKDIHGCIGSAGYSWCEVKNKCLRVWEEKCEVATTTIPKLECKSDADCKEISCVSGGFAHELCTQGKCTMSDVVKNKCSTPVKTSCTPNWQCGWSQCSNGYQGMVPTDSNNCASSLTSTIDMVCPALARVCDTSTTTTNPVACTMDAMMCPDGTYVGRSAPDCKFICPAVEPNIGAGENGFCGGIAGIRCASGLTCKYDGTYPDAGGKCIKESFVGINLDLTTEAKVCSYLTESKSKYACPECRAVDKGQYWDVSSYCPGPTQFPMMGESYILKVDKVYGTIEIVGATKTIN